MLCYLLSARSTHMQHHRLSSQTNDLRLQPVSPLVMLKPNGNCLALSSVALVFSVHQPNSCAPCAPSHQVSNTVDRRLSVTANSHPYVLLLTFSRGNRNPLVLLSLLLPLLFFSLAAYSAFDDARGSLVQPFVSYLSFRIPLTANNQFLRRTTWPPLLSQPRLRLAAPRL
jgi:hypothetical protein